MNNQVQKLSLEDIEQIQKVLQEKNARLSIQSGDGYNRVILYSENSDETTNHIYWRFDDVATETKD